MQTDTLVSPPRAPKHPHTHTEHGVVRQDDYYWLRDDKRENPEMLNYLKAENTYTKNALAHTDSFQEALFQEMKGRIKEQDESVPYFLNGYWYFVQFREGKEYPIYCRKKGTMEDDQTQELLDANKRGRRHAYYNVGNLEVSPDQRLLAFAEDTVSRRIYDLRFKIIASDIYYREVIRGVDTDIAWADDNKTVYYVRQHPETLRSYQIYSHELGTDPKEDVLLYEETDETFYLTVHRSRSGKYIVATAHSTQTDQVFLMRSDGSETAFRPFVARQKDHKYEVSHLGDRFFVRTNWKAKNFRLMEVPEEATADPSQWKEVVPHRGDVFLENFETFREHLVIQEREAGLTKLRVRRLDDQSEQTIRFDDPTYAAGIGYNPEQDSALLRYIYTSLTTPRTVYQYDMVSGERSLLKQTEVLGDFDPENYISERRWVTARDGESVPVSIVYRKGVERNASHPLYVYAYGSYGISSEAAFSSTRLSLLDRGLVFAIAHIRGGEEMGRPWYEAGKLLKKKNTFTDFVDCTRFLLEEKYGDPERVFAMGGSAGGLLMGAVANMNPELYTGMIAHVPFVDIVTTMLDESIPLTTFEYDEWGNPNEKTFFDYMLSYSPYDQIKAQDYPHLLVTAGLYDSQVQYWEPAKWVAKLREYKTDTNRLLLHMNMDAGHGGSSGRFRRLRETALEYAFVLDLCGISD